MELIEKILQMDDPEWLRATLYDLKPSYSECIKIRRVIGGKNGLIEGNKKLNVALVGSYTLSNLKEPMWVSLVQKGFLPEITLGEYDQYMQALLNPQSKIRSVDPDIIVIFLDTETFLDIVYNKISHKEKISIIESKIAYLKSALLSLKQTKAHIVLMNLAIPHYSPLGFRDPNSEEGVRNLVNEANKMIFVLKKELHNLTIFDFEDFASYYGKKNLRDEKYWYIGKLYISNEMSPVLCRELASLIASYYGKIKKCLAVDLDNTLWGGVIGEEGVGGIKLGDNETGKIYSDIQKIILDLNKNGVILAINSKNNIEDVEPVFSHHGMVLKKENFAVIKCNWNDKALNLVDISSELNIGLDSIVVLDDNPVERISIKRKFPQVTVIDFPEDIAELPEVLKSIRFFDVLNLSGEDLKRTKMYLEEMGRDELKKQFTNLNDYLFDLGMVVCIEKFNEENIERVTQLINKTNQFNLRTMRYSKEEVKRLMENSMYRGYAVSLADKFGEFGIIGVLIFRQDERNWFVDTFLLSCRAMSRGVENVFLKKCIEDLPSKKIICGEYIRTPKNTPVENFYKEFGFEFKNGLWWLDNSKKEIKNVDWIRLDFNG